MFARTCQERGAKTMPAPSSSTHRSCPIPITPAVGAQYWPHTGPHQHSCRAVEQPPGCSPGGQAAPCSPPGMTHSSCTGKCHKSFLPTAGWHLEEVFGEVLALRLCSQTQQVEASHRLLWPCEFSHFSQKCCSKHPIANPACPSVPKFQALFLRQCFPNTSWNG